MIDLDPRRPGHGRSIATAVISVTQYERSGNYEYDLGVGNVTENATTRASRLTVYPPRFTTNVPGISVTFPSNAPQSRANGIAMTDGGVAIVGAIETGQAFHAFMNDDRHRYDLGTLPGTDPTTTNSEAYDINRDRSVVGYCETPDGGRHAFLSLFSGTRATGGIMVDLGVLAGGRNSEARALTNTANPLRVVGFSQTASGTRHAVLWWGLPSQNQPYDLNLNRPTGDPFIRNNVGWELIEAYDINDNGWIVGWGMHEGQERAFLLRPR